MEQKVISGGVRQGGNRHRIVDIISGYLAAWTFVTVGQPLDYLKVQYQINSKLPSWSHIYHDIGASGFYRGASSIYLMIGTINAFEFFSFELFCDFFSNMGWVESNNQRKPSNLMASGFMTGAVSALIYTPIQFAKIQCQTSKTSTLGSVSIMTQTLRQQGLLGLRELYTGLGMTMTRETFGSAIYYGGYHLIMSKLFCYERTKAPVWAQVTVGTMAGMLYQLFSFPFDAIKTNLQSHHKTATQMISQKFWKTTSFRKGLSVSLFRSLLADSTNFIVYENSRKILLSKFYHYH